MKCFTCWLQVSPYVAVTAALLAWWSAWEEPKRGYNTYLEPISQELIQLDEASKEDGLGLQVTLIPSPNFADISLSEDRKQSFIAWLLPFIGRENERLSDMRKEATRLYGLSQQHRLSLKQKEWLIDVATDYEVDVGHKGFDLIFWQNLLHRLDVIPPSLVLTQAAIESGWGVSRLAKDANNFFGIMCFQVGCGVQMPNVSGEFRRFSSPQESIAFYMHILNTKGAYRAARMERMKNRLVGEVPSGLVLAKTLLNYSELGGRYISLLLQVMRDNRLDDYDGADMQALVEVAAVPATNTIPTETVTTPVTAP